MKKTFITLLLVLILSLASCGTLQSSKNRKEASKFFSLLSIKQNIEYEEAKDINVNDVYGSGIRGRFEKFTFMVKPNIKFRIVSVSFRVITYSSTDFDFIFADSDLIGFVTKQSSISTDDNIIGLHEIYLDLEYKFSYKTNSQPFEYFVINVRSTGNTDLIKMYSNSTEFKISDLKFEFDET